MRKLTLMLLMACCLVCNAQTRQVKVVTMHGTKYVGVLKEFKAFEHVILTVKDKDIMIPYKDMAYIDEITPVTPVSAQTEPEPVKVEAEPVKVEAEPVKAEKEPVVEPVSEPVAELVKAEAEPVKVEAEPVKVEKEPVVEPALAPVLAPVVESVAEPVSEPVEAPETSKWQGYKGFVLEKGNCVYLDCVSDPKDEGYDEAAYDVLKRQLNRDGFWTIVDNPEDAHFSIVCLVSREGKGKASIAISSLLTGKDDRLGAEKGPEDVNDYRKVVWELYNKYILPLQRKIDSNKIPKQTIRNFTVD